MRHEGVECSRINVDAVYGQLLGRFFIGRGYFYIFALIQ